MKPVSAVLLTAPVVRCSITLSVALSLMSAPMAHAQTSAEKAEKKPTRPPSSRTEIKSKANQTATGIMAAEAALTPGELAIAGRVYTGKLPCELGAFVTLTPDAKKPGFFDVRVKNLKFTMFPVETTTGAIRLEDRKAGAVWLQLANKSMLMNQKLGQRLADACMNPAQVAVAEALEKNPGRSVLDAADAAPGAALGPKPATTIPATK
jgi:hypothetical protein